MTSPCTISNLSRLLPGDDGLCPITPGGGDRLSRQPHLGDEVGEVLQRVVEVGGPELIAARDVLPTSEAAPSGVPRNAGSGAVLLPSRALWRVERGDSDARQARSKLRRRGEAGCSSAWRIEDTRLVGGIRDEDLALETIRVDEEHRQDRAEVSDEIISGAAGHQATPDLFERFQRSCLESHVVETAPTEHRRLMVSLGVGVDLEHVQLAPVADVDERELEARLLLDRARWRRVEDVCVETRQALRVPGEHGHVVHAVQQHRPSIDQDLRGTRGLVTPDRTSVAAPPQNAGLRHHGATCGSN
jgi:hypothetical protein